jgi:hypothetical protein
MHCGCVVGRYRDVASTREVAYVEEKGVACDEHGHRRNHILPIVRERTRVPGRASGFASRAS